MTTLIGLVVINILVTFRCLSRPTPIYFHGYLFIWSSCLSKMHFTE